MSSSILILNNRANPVYGDTDRGVITKAVAEGKEDILSPEHQEMLDEYLADKTEEHGTTIEQEKSVLRTNFELSAQDGKNTVLDNSEWASSVYVGLQRVGSWLGISDMSYNGYWSPAVLQMQSLHHDMRADMIGPIFEEDHNFNFDGDQAQQEYQQALNGMQEAFLNLRNTTAEQEWANHFDITEIEQEGGMPVIAISGELDGVSFSRQYLPNEDGQYEGAGSLRVTSTGPDGQPLTQDFRINDSLNVSFEESGDPTPDSKPAYLPENNW